MIVFISNLIGTALIAGAFAAPVVLPGEVHSGVLEVARHLGALSPAEVFWKGIPAGWIIATLVWMLPSAETAKVWVIVAMTYLISLLGLTHVVAGAVEVFVLVWAGELDLPRALISFVLPMLLGNVIGGSALFAALSFGQVKEELGER